MKHSLALVSSLSAAVVFGAAFLAAGASLPLVTALYALAGLGFIMAQDYAPRARLALHVASAKVTATYAARESRRLAA